MDKLVKNDLKLNISLIMIIVLGHLILAMDIFLEHYEHLAYNKFTWIPIIWGLIVGIVGLGICLVRFSYFSINLLKIMMILSITVGILGLYYHNEWRVMSIIDAIKNDLPLTVNLAIGYTPLLAPSAFCALGLIGLLILSYELQRARSQ